jgi:hypothetical protein
MLSFSNNKEMSITRKKRGLKHKDIDCEEKNCSLKA